MRRFVVIGALALMSVGILAAMAIASEPSSGTSSDSSARRAHGNLSVGVKVDRFAAHRRRLDAQGIVKAVLTDNAGHRKVVRQRVTLSASSAGGCRVLHLRLDRLDLSLLGLNAHLDKVVLDITGKRSGGVLGKLFCQLASSSNIGRREALARRMTRRMQASGGGRALRFTTHLNGRATTSATGTCKVLDLVVGPLNLELLGLVVDLNQVHLAVTATRGQGVLGDLFCQLADNNASGGSTGATGPTGATGTTGSTGTTGATG
jgi:hypothetical protein